MAADKNCIPSRFSKSTERIKSKLLCNIYQSLDVRDEKSASLELPHRLDRERLIQPRSQGLFPGQGKDPGKEVEAHLERIFKVLGKEMIFYVFMPSLLRKLVLSFLCMSGSY